MSNNQNAAIDFLLYSYFGIDAAEGKDNSDLVLNGAINRAYRDASSHVLSVEDEKVKKQKREKAAEAISDAVKNLKKESEYGEWHKKLCDQLVGLYANVKCKEGKKFTYGIAQKWVNMTMKYLYLLDPLLKEYGYSAETIHCASDHEEALHVPIDSYIIQAAKDMGVKVQDIEPWSKIESYDVYIQFQTSLHDKLKETPYKSLIEWEGPAWIQEAKKA